MKKTVTIEVEVEVEIPDAVIPEMFADYLETIDPSADEDCLFEQVAHAMTFGKYSGEDFVEGIGSLSKQGILWEEIEVSTVVAG